jgi:hypothetical protein
MNSGSKVGDSIIVGMVKAKQTGDEKERKRRWSEFVFFVYVRMFSTR